MTFLIKFGLNFLLTSLVIFRVSQSPEANEAFSTPMRGLVRSI